MIKHGTKYINESEWFEEVDLSDLYDEETGRFKRNPPIGTRVKVITESYDEPLHGEVVKYYDENNDPRLVGIVFCLLIDGGWQIDRGWDCSQEHGLKQYGDSKCYWIDAEDDEVYLETPPLPVVDIQESEEDLQWAQDVVSTPFNLKGKAWHINLNRNDGGESSEKIQKWLFNQGFSWAGGRNRVDHGNFSSIQSVFDSDIRRNTFTYSDTKESVADDVESSREIAKKDGYNYVMVFNYDDIIQDSLNESEDDDLTWAEDVVSQNPIPKRIKLGDNKRFVIPSNGMYNKPWHKFVGWNYWRDVTGNEILFDEDCYKITDDTYGDIYIPVSEFKQDELQYGTLNESEDDDLEWAEDSIKNIPLITVTHNDELMPEQHQYYWVETIYVWNRSSLSKDGTKIIQMGGTSSPEYRIKFFLERGGYVEITSESIKYIVDDVVELSSIPRQGALWGKIRDFLLSLQVRMPINESEDLGWAEETVSSNPIGTLGQLYNILDNDDIIKLSGPITDDEENVLCILDGETFKVVNKIGHRLLLYWVRPRTERPQGWDEISNIKNSDEKDELPVYMPHSSNPGFDDSILTVEIVKKNDNPF